MSAPAPFYLITDNAREACILLFARDPQFAPAFVTVVTELGQLVAIPAGARATALWFHRDGVMREVWREQVRHRLDCGRGWQIFDEVMAWRATLWSEAESDQPAAKAAETPESLPRQRRWS
jgi:hypothetical protein